MVCVVSYIRVLVSETLPWPTCVRRSKISGHAENFASRPSSVGERSWNSDLGWRGSLQDQGRADPPGPDRCSLPVRDRPITNSGSCGQMARGGDAGQVAWQGGGFDAGQVARQDGALMPGRWPGGFDAKAGTWRGSAGWRRGFIV